MALAETVAAMEWGECWLPEGPVPRALAQQIRREVGMLPAWSGRFSAVPWLARSAAAIPRTTAAFMPPHLADLVALVVSQDNACRYCYGITRTVLRVLGHDDGAIDRVERDLDLAEMTAADRAALDFARRISRADPRPGPDAIATLERLGFSRGAVAEIAWTAAASVFANRIATLFALPPERVEGWVDHPVGRLLRPVVAWWLRPRPVPPAPLPAPNDGPCAAVVAALAGSPAAGRLRVVIDEAMASPVLPRRTKLLMLAVVGRALDCARAEDEAREGLGAEGLAPGEVDRIVADLGGPGLDGRDALLVPYARETVRYRNGDIQRRTRLLAERLPLEEVLEAGGIAALANAVCRLSVLLDAC